MSNSPEHIFQQDVVDALRWNGITTINCDPMIGLQFLPKDTPRRYKFVNYLKSAGYTNGQPDLVLMLADGETLYVELKSPDGTQSDDQKLFEWKATKMGHNYIVWRSMDEVKDFIRGYKLMILKGGNNGKFEKENNGGTSEDEGRADSQE